MHEQLDYDFAPEELEGCLLHKSCTCIEESENAHIYKRISHVPIVQKQKEQLRDMEAIDEYWNDNKAYITNLIAQDLHEKHR